MRRERPVWMLMLSIAMALMGDRAAIAGTRNSGDATFFSVADLGYDHSAVPTLKGGRAAKPRLWPATVYSISSLGSCTSTLVGPRVLIMAAHCVGNGRQVTIAVGSRTYTGTCSHPATYEGNPPNPTADWALCLMNDDPHVAYERINTDPSRLAVRQELTLSGLGCTDDLGSNDGIYRIGEALIATLPAGSNNYISTTGMAVLCLGDSGGGAYLFANPQDERGRRVQVAVNAEVVGRTYSQLASTSTIDAVAFFTAWSTTHAARICGLTPDPRGCR